MEGLNVIHVLSNEINQWEGKVRSESILATSELHETANFGWGRSECSSTIIIELISMRPTGVILSHTYIYTARSPFLHPFLCCLESCPTFYVPEVTKSAQYQHLQITNTPLINLCGFYRRLTYQFTTRLLLPPSCPSIIYSLLLPIHSTNPSQQCLPQLAFMTSVNSAISTSLTSPQATCSPSTSLSPSSMQSSSSPSGCL